MPSTSKRTKWPLPETVHPVGSKCVTINIPDDPAYNSAFWGAIYELTKPYAWGDDEDHTAIDVGAVWTEIYDEARANFLSQDCAMAIQFRQPNSCALEVSLDGGVTWDQIYTAEICVEEGIQDRLDDGTLAPGGQPGGGGSTPTQECYTYHIEISGNGRWYAPIPVRDGYTIVIQNLDGVWSEGNGITSNWYCPDGDQFVLGACTSFYTLNPADPLPTVKHMKLIGNIGGTYLDLIDALYTVPNGTGTVDLTLQANDDLLSDNQGSIRGLVTICTGLWCFEWDFTVSDGGWTVQPGEAGSYSAGVGWIAVFLDSQDYEVAIRKTFTSTFIIDVVMTFDRSGHGGANANYRTIVQLSGASVATNIVSPGSDGTNLTLTTNVNHTADAMWAQVNNGTAAVPATIKKMRIRGTGANPFGASNC